MKIRIRHLTLGCALIYALCTTQTASAWYIPSAQRWVTRDPLGEAGFEAIRLGRTTLLGDGPNAYLLVGNSPVLSQDYYGLFRDCAQESIDCNRRCMNRRAPWPVENSDQSPAQNLQARVAYCEATCQALYMQCEEENRKELERDRKEHQSFCERHPAVCVALGYVLSTCEEWAPIVVLGL